MAYYMEKNLDMKLRDILPVIQERIMNQSSYFGIPTLKSPNDYWVYQEIIFDMKPDIIIEIGNHRGGSTLALAHMCDLLDNGKVIGIDISQSKISELVKSHPRITLIEGDACQSYEKVSDLISENETVLIIEDSNHRYSNTLNILHTYSHLTKPGDYFIIEDSIIQHGLDYPEYKEKGSYEAIEQFVKENDKFVIDRSKESFLITWNPKGYLKRIK